jgi:hypothetical protein
VNGGEVETSAVNTSRDGAAFVPFVETDGLMNSFAKDEA